MIIKSHQIASFPKNSGVKNSPPTNLCGFPPKTLTGKLRKSNQGAKIRPSSGPGASGGVGRASRLGVVTWVVEMDGNLLLMDCQLTSNCWTNDVT